MPKRSVAVAVLLASLLGTVGCQSDVGSRLALAGLSQTCRINSDCGAELVCVFERCHEQCRSSRDCERGARCVAGPGKRNVCQLADEATCSEAGSCPGAQVCGADAACRDACSSDGECLTEQVCSGGTCADGAELGASGELTPAPDRPLGAPPPCAYDSDCPGELVCVAGSCAVECQAEGDCGGGQTCRAGRCQSLEATSVGCRRNSDCALGEQCVEATCKAAPSTPEPACAYDSDCETAGQHCEAGNCRCECASDADCSVNQRCAGGCQCAFNRVIVGNVNVSNSQQLRALQDVVEVTGELTFDIPGLGEYHLPSLRKAGFVGGFEHEATLVFEALEDVAGMTCYQDCRAPSLKHVGALAINSQVVREVALPALESVDDFRVLYSSRLESVSAPRLKSAKTLRLEGNTKLGRIELPELAAVDTLIVSMNDRLTALSLPKANPTEAISMASNSALLIVELPAVSRLSSTLVIGACPLLQTLDFAGLQQVSGVSFYDMPKLSRLDLSRLTQIRDNLQFSYGAGPAVLELPLLTQLTQLTLFHVAGIGSVRAPLLTQADQVSVIGASQLTEVALPVRSLPTQLYLQDNPKLQSVRFPDLEGAGSLHVGGSPELSALQLPSLTQVDGVYIGGTGISNLDSLNPDLGGSLTTAGDINITFNPALPTCAVDSLGAALAAKGWPGVLFQTSNLECSCNGAVCQ